MMDENTRKKDVNRRALYEKKKKDYIEALKKKQKEMTVKFAPLIKYMRKHGLREHDCVVNNESRQLMFRADEFIQCCVVNKSQIQEFTKDFFEFLDVTDRLHLDDIKSETSPDKLQDQGQRIITKLEREVYPFAQYLLDQKVLVRLDREEYDQMKDKKKKYPKRLLIGNEQVPGPVNHQTFDKCFFYFNVEIKSKYRTLLMWLIIVGVILICLFPIWPRQTKVWIFYLSVFLLVLLMGIIIIRLILFVILRIFGVEFWWFPNLWQEEDEFFASFKPFMSYERCKDGWIAVLGRITGFFMLLGMAYFLHQDPKILEDFAKGTQDSFDDAMDWGIMKMIDGPPRDESFGRPSIEQLQDEWKQEDSENKGKKEEEKKNIKLEESENIDDIVVKKTQEKKESVNTKKEEVKVKKTEKKEEIESEYYTDEEGNVQKKQKIIQESEYSDDEEVVVKKTEIKKEEESEYSDYEDEKINQQNEKTVEENTCSSGQANCDNNKIVNDDETEDEDYLDKYAN